MPLTIGQQLKNARLDHNLSLEDVFESIYIRIKYLEALEANDFSIMPSPAQGRGFLRLYAQHLELDIDAILAEMRNVETTEDAPTFKKVGKISATEVEEILEEVADTEALSDEKEVESIWARILRRVGVSLASPEPAPVQETESDPIEEASPTPAPEALPTSDKPASVDETIVQESSHPKEESRIIYARIGAILRDRREMLSLTYDEIEGHLHLRPFYLAALETGDFESLPSSVQTRGMLNNYADFLDLDTDALLLEFAEGLQAQRIERHLEMADQFQGATKKRRRKFSLGGFVAPDLIFGVGLTALLIAFSIWGLGRIAKMRVETRVGASAPSISEILMSTPTMTADEIITPTVVLVNTLSVEAGTLVPLDETLFEEENPGVQILVTILERAWMRVNVDGKLVFEGRAQPDATFVYEGNEQVEILTANGAGVRIAYNQRDLGLMGGFGEVVLRIYGARAILTPTVTPTLPATATPTPTITPSPTLTPLATEVGSTE